ncbi:MAG: hypothetical protein IT221_15380 [Fluviicola sp.]|nr:hypothetical protein [Fluviicola sp.]
MIKTRLVIFFFLVNFHLFSQDTIHFESRENFDQLIQYTFKDYTGGLNGLIRGAIDNEFAKYDFSRKEYDCQYVVDLNLEIDSMGMIKNCKQISNFQDSQLNKFVTNVEEIIEKSGWRIQNWVNLTDTSYFIHLVQLNFEISCDPSKLIFQISHKENTSKTTVLALKNGNTFIYFDGFKNYTIENKKRRKSKRHVGR